MLLAGLDIETTGLYHNQGHRLIQIGIAVLDTETGNYNEFSSDVKPIGKIAYNDVALKINGFTKKRINAAPTQDRIDTILWQQMLDAGYKLDSLTPVGWNLIAFDLPFIRKELPLVATLFRYPNDEHGMQAIDLMSLGLFHCYQSGKDYASIKRQVKDEVSMRLGENKEHDALYDAKGALEALKVYKEIFGSGV